MRIEEYRKWLAQQFLDETVEEETPLETEVSAAPEPVVEPVQWAPAPPPPPPPAPAWRPPSTPGPSVVAEVVDTTQPGPAAYIGRPPAQSRPPAQERAAAPPPAPPTIPQPQAAPERIDTEPVAVQPARVIDTDEEVAPPIDRYFRVRRPAPTPEQLPLEELAPEPSGVAARPEPAPPAEVVSAEPVQQPEPAAVAAEIAQEEPAPNEAAVEPAEAPDRTPTLLEPERAPEAVQTGPVVPEASPEVASPRAEERQPEPEPPSVSVAAQPEVAEQPPAKPAAPVRRARHARNVRPTEVVREMDAATLWSLVPRHIQTLVAMDSEEVTQNSYKRAFRESRLELIQRLLDPTLSLEETSRLLNVCPTTVRRYTNRGLLTHQRTSGDQRRFKLSDVLAFLEAQQRARE